MVLRGCRRERSPSASRLGSSSEPGRRPGERHERGPSDDRTTIAVYVATYRRNEPLATLLESILVAADAVADLAAVGMIVVDDNPDGAKAVVDRFEGRFELGIHYRHVGLGNISIVRNIGLDAGIELAEWVAMTDDDCVVSPQWLAELLYSAVPAPTRYRTVRAADPRRPGAG